MQYNHIFQNLARVQLKHIIKSHNDPQFYFFKGYGREKYIQANIFLFNTAKYITNGEILKKSSRGCRSWAQLSNFGRMYLNIYLSKEIYLLLFQCKIEAHAIFLNPLSFSHCANGNLSFVHLFTKKETEVIRLQTD